MADQLFLGVIPAVVYNNPDMINKPIRHSKEIFAVNATWESEYVRYNGVPNQAVTQFRIVFQMDRGRMISKPRACKDWSRSCFRLSINFLR